MFALYSGVGILSLFYCKGFPEPLIANIGNLPASFVFIADRVLNLKTETMKMKMLFGVLLALSLLCGACTPQPDADEESQTTGAGTGPMIEDEREDL